MNSSNKHVLVTYMLAMVLILSGCMSLTPKTETDHAIQNLKESVKKDPQNEKLRLALINAYVSNYMRSEGGVGYLDDAIQEAKEAIRLNAQSGLIYLVLSNALIAKGIENQDDQLIKEAHTAYNTAILMSSEIATDDQLPPLEFMAAFVHIKKWYQNNKNIEPAILELKQAIRTKPNYAPSYIMLGEMYLTQEKKELALELLQESVRIDPNIPEAHTMLGDLYAEQKHEGKDHWNNAAIDAGIKEFNEVIRLEPKNDYAHAELSMLYEHKGNYAQQMFEAKEAVRLSSNTLNHIALGQAYLTANDLDQALKEFKIAQNLTPDYSGSSSKILFTYYLQRKYSDVAKEFKTYRKIDDEPSCYVIIWYYISLKHMQKHGEAQKLLIKYASASHWNPWEISLMEYFQGKLSDSELISKARHDGDVCEAYYYIGSNYLIKKDLDTARDYFKKVLNTNMICFSEYTASYIILEQMQGEK